MSTVELRPRRREAAHRGRETQGWLAMQDADSGTETVQASVGRGLSRRPTAARPGPRSARPTAPRPPLPLPHRQVVAAWPDDWRERWGRRANALEDLGLSWRDAEGRAFLEVWTEWRGTADVVGRN